MLKTGVVLNVDTSIQDFLTIEECNELINYLKSRFDLGLVDVFKLMLDNLDGYKIEEENEYLENFCKNYLTTNNKPLLDSKGNIALFWDSVYLNSDEEFFLLQVAGSIKKQLLRSLKPTWDWYILVNKEYSLDNIGSILIEIKEDE